MLIDSDGAPSETPTADLPPFPYRPAAPDHGPGRLLRVFVGIREDVLDCVPADRPRYTGLGIIVFNTGCLAALAMLTALGKIVSAPAPFMIAVALAWGWIIVSIDRWLITSTHGLRGGNRFLIFAPRLILAILIALSIAEPLTLRIFQPSINAQVKESRAASLISYGSLLKTCNPATGVIVTSARCARYQLSLPNSPGSVQQELSGAEVQESQTQRQVNDIERAASRLRTAARDECAGVAGSGLSGQSGVGFRCRHDYNALSQYQSSSGLPTEQALVKSLGNRVAELTVRLGSARHGYAAAIHAAIVKAVATLRSSQGKIGILDEWKALGQLTSQSSLVAFGRWLVWVLLIVLDCLPILSKLMNGYTAYDYCLTRQLDSDDRINDVDVRLREQQETADKEVDIRLNEIRRQGLIERFYEDERVSRAQRDAELINSVEELANRWIREGQADGSEWRESGDTDDSAGSSGP